MNKETFRVTLGFVLKHLTVDAKLTQQQLADGVGLSQSMVSRWFNGYTMPDAWEVQRAAKVLKLPLDAVYMLVDETVSRLRTEEPRLIEATAMLVIADFRRDALGKGRFSRGATLLRGP